MFHTELETLLLAGHSATDDGKDVEESQDITTADESGTSSRKCKPTTAPSDPQKKPKGKGGRKKALVEDSEPSGPATETTEPDAPASGSSKKGRQGRGRGKKDHPFKSPQEVPDGADKDTEMNEPGPQENQMDIDSKHD